MSPPRSRHAREPLFTVLCAFLVFLAAAGCAKKHSAKIPRTPPQRYSETGIASWYGHPYHGRRAANGEVYDMYQFTAAHRTLPFETIVRVTNLQTSKTVDVRITDRGPFIEGRIIDLSRAAAQKIDVILPGTAKVRIDAIQMTVAPPSGASLYAVQVGAFREKRTAENLRQKLARTYSPVEISERDSNPKLWRVLVGRESSIASAQDLAGRIASDAPGGFVVRIDR